MLEPHDVENVNISLDVCKKLARHARTPKNTKGHERYTKWRTNWDTGTATPCGHTGSFYTSLRTLYRNAIRELGILNIHIHK